MTRFGWRRGWSVWSIGCRQRNGLADSNEAINLVGDTTGSRLDARGENDSGEEVQLLEAGRVRPSFAWAVMTAVEIEEEGLFRNIVAHL